MTPLEITAVILSASVLILLAVLALFILAAAAIAAIFAITLNTLAGRLWSMTEASREAEGKAWAECRRILEEIGPPPAQPPERRFSDGGKPKTEDQAVREALKGMFGEHEANDGPVVSAYAVGNPSLPGLSLVGAMNGRDK